jgi:hypothetical protein
MTTQRDILIQALTHLREAQALIAKLSKPVQQACCDDLDDRILDRWLDWEDNEAYREGQPEPQRNEGLPIVIGAVIENMDWGLRPEMVTAQINCPVCGKQIDTQTMCQCGYAFWSELDAIVE